MKENELEDAWARYERSEKAYLEALAGGLDDETLSRCCADVANAVRQVERLDMTADTPSGINRYYDVSEVLSGLWADIDRAYTERRGSAGGATLRTTPRA